MKKSQIKLEKTRRVASRTLKAKTPGNPPGGASGSWIGEVANVLRQAAGKKVSME